MNFTIGLNSPSSFLPQICYNPTPIVEFSTDAILVVHIILPMLLYWMTYKILKNGIPSQPTFDEYFYDDSDYRRNGSDVS